MLNKNTVIKIGVVKKVFERYNYTITINTERVNGGQLTWLSAIGNDRMFSLQLNLFEKKESVIKAQSINTLCFKEYTCEKELDFVDYKNSRKKITKKIIQIIKEVHENAFVLPEELINELYIALTNSKLLERYYEVSNEVKMLINKIEDDAM